MKATGGGEFSMVRVFAVAAIALLGMAFALTPWAERLDNGLLDIEWAVLLRFDSRPARDDIIIVGIDERTGASIAAPPGMWHESLGLALARVASAKPRAVGLDIALPDRSFDDVRPGLDRALLVGLAAVRQNGPLVASLSIDARTRSARHVHAPFLALLGEERLGIGLLASDIDGVTRRFSLGVPTEDGAFPTLAGRLCRAISTGCVDGLLDFALGEPFRYVPLQRVLETRDTAVLRGLFANRIVLMGDVHAFGNRIAVPVNLAGWERQARHSPAVVVHAQALRTALSRAAPRETSKPAVAILVSLMALLVLARDLRSSLAGGVLIAASLLVLATLSLRAGQFLPVAGALFTLSFAWLSGAGYALSRRYELRRRD